MCQGKITCARSLSIRFLPTATPRADQPVDFWQDAGRIEDHAGGHHALHVGAKDAAGNQRQFVALPSLHHGMARVGAALVADHDVLVLGEQVDDLAFGLVAPLQTNNARTRHSVTPFETVDNRGVGKLPQALHFNGPPPAGQLVGSG